MSWTGEKGEAGAPVAPGQAGIGLYGLLHFLCEGMTDLDLATAYVLSKISTRIVEERINRNLTQAEFAALMGVTQGEISNWENGDYNFTVAELVNIFVKLNQRSGNGTYHNRRH
jgi:DNA-binding XRE family transcriptional regulator